jgi:hypothetical protein
MNRKIAYRAGSSREIQLVAQKKKLKSRKQKAEIQNYRTIAELYPTPSGFSQDSATSFTHG